MKKLKYLYIVFILALIVGFGFYINSSANNNNSAVSTSGQYVDKNGRGLIKGNINSKGEKIYHMPGQQFYNKTDAEKYFKTEKEAQNAGFRKSKK